MSMSTFQKNSQDTANSDIDCWLDDVAFHPLGQHAQQFSFDRDEDVIRVCPHSALTQRCTIRPMAIFEHRRGYPELCTAMERMHFSSGVASSLEYRALTHDPDRCLKELFFHVEASPYDDDWMPTAQRWRNWETVTKQLLERAKIKWLGLCDDQINQLLTFHKSTEPIIPCVYHALTQALHDRGECMIEVSYHGRSMASISAMALNAIDSDVPIISIDSGSDQLCHVESLRLSLSQIGQSHRLIQIPYTSNKVDQWIRNESASLIYIDGNHSHQSVISDIEKYTELLAPGGGIAIPNYGFGIHNEQLNPHPDVRRAVDELMFGNNTFRPLLQAHGLMVFVKKEVD